MGEEGEGGGGGEKKPRSSFKNGLNSSQERAGKCYNSADRFSPMLRGRWGGEGQWGGWTGT